MSAPGTIAGNDGVTIGQQANTRSTDINHRLDSKDQPRHQFFSRASHAKGRPERRFTHSISDAMTDQIFGEGKTSGSDDRAYGGTNIADGFPRLSGLNALFKRRSGFLDQFS